jgi:hypothetical protein
MIPEVPRANTPIEITFHSVARETNQIIGIVIIKPILIEELHEGKYEDRGAFKALISILEL